MTISRAESQGALRALGVAGSLMVYVPAAVLLLVVTRWAIPRLSASTGIEPIFFWFLGGGLGVFLPLIIVAALVLRAEGHKWTSTTWTGRLRFSRLRSSDLIWALGALVVASTMGGLAMYALQAVTGTSAHTPVFMSFAPLSPGRYWLLAVWLPYWVLNIMGEEILWRGVMLPRQELAFGRHAWIVHAVGWGLFHVAFGWQLLITLTPLLFVQSYVVQKTHNSWVGVLIHGGINGPSFIAIAFGML